MTLAELQAMIQAKIGDLNVSPPHRSDLQDIMLGMLENVGALQAASLGAAESYDQDTDGAQTLLAANGNGEGDRAVLIIVDTIEAFDDGDGAQTVFIIGQTGTTNKFMANTVLVDSELGERRVLAGVLTEETALLVTGTAATGTGTGGISVFALAFPAAA